jgi:drug/metabolite transporter (DMT)-like permease
VSSSAHNRIGLGLALGVLGYMTLPFMDAIAKSFQGTHNAAMVSFGRMMIQVLLLTPLLALRYGPALATPPKAGWHILRGVLLGLSSLCFFSGVMLMPLATATTLVFTQPLFVVALAALLLGERTSPAHILLILLGFAGVLVIIRPGLGGFGWPAVLPVAAAFWFGLMMVLTRRLSGTASAEAMQLYSAIGAVIVLAAALMVGALTRFAPLAPQALSLRDIGLLSAMAVIGFAAHYMLTQAARFAPANMVAPMVYSQIITSAGLGWAIWGDVPDLFTWIGLALIIASGVAISRLPKTA